VESINRKWKESGSNLPFKDWVESENKKNHYQYQPQQKPQQKPQNSEYILKRVERNFKEYAGSYLWIDNIRYEKGLLIISRTDDKGSFTEVEKSMIDRFLSLYKPDMK